MADFTLELEFATVSLIIVGVCLCALFMKRLLSSIKDWISPPPNEPVRVLIDYQNMQDPKPPLIEPREAVRERKTCIGYLLDTGRAVYMDLEDVFTHILVLGKTGVGKSIFVISTYLYYFICFFKDASVIVFDATDGVIDECLALAKIGNRKVVVVPDQAISILRCAGKYHDFAQNLASLYLQIKGIQGRSDGSHYQDVVVNFIIKAVPLLFATYPDEDIIIEDLLLFTTNADVRLLTLNDAPDHLPEKRDYLKAFGRTSPNELTHDISGLKTFLTEFTTGEYASMLNVRGAPSLQDLINDPERPIIIIRAGDDEGTSKHVLGKLMIFQLSGLINKRKRSKKNHPCLVFLDEGGLFTFLQLGSMLTLARKKKFGFVIGLQDVEQVPEKFRNIFVEQCRTKMAQADLPYENAVLFEKSLGRGKYEFTSVTVSYEPNGTKKEQVNKHRDLDSILTTDEIMNIPIDEVIVQTPYKKAKRTPLKLKKPFLEFEKLEIEVEEYEEPDVLLYPPQTIWEMRGYTIPMPLPQGQQAKASQISNQINQAVAQAGKASQLNKKSQVNNNNQAVAQAKNKNKNKTIP